MLEKVTISGYRGFDVDQTIKFALPSGSPGTGLTILVGSNNSGKSTIIEAINFFSDNQPPNITEGKRNSSADSKVEIVLSTSDHKEYGLRTIPNGGSQTERFGNQYQEIQTKIFVLPPRRYFSAFFSEGTSSREQYIKSYAMPVERQAAINQFSNRLFQIQENREKFDKVLAKIISPVPTWTIDRYETGQNYLKLKTESSYHNSDGVGDGIISLFFIVDALYDSKPGDLIAIDEPELSLHPSLQKRLFQLLKEFSSDRQIIISTHSPYLVDFETIYEGARIYRVFKEGCCRVASFEEETIKKIGRLVKNLNNPHLFGIDAREVFFLKDSVILVEGQDDVKFYPYIAKQLEMEFKGDFFGWGVGGADNMHFMSKMLSDLKYRKVVGILDNNKASSLPQLQKDFPDYQYYVISAEDVRDKPEQKSKSAKSGLTDSRGILKPEYLMETQQLISEINDILK